MSAFSQKRAFQSERYGCCSMGNQQAFETSIGAAIKTATATIQ
jgi:hypothetical protein